MLTVGVHLNDMAEPPRVGAPQANGYRAALADVLLEPDYFDMALGRVQLCDGFPRWLAAAVVYDDDWQSMPDQMSRNYVKNLIMIVRRDDGAKLLLHLYGTSIKR
jgi:hypothetical protein